MKQITLTFVLLLSFSSFVRGQETPRHPVIDTARLIEVFYEAVERGELMVFELKIDRSMIEPTEITYSYDLKGFQNTVLVIGNITKPVVCRYSKNFYIKSVTARLNDQGNIVEVMHDMIPVFDTKTIGNNQ